MNRIDFEVKYFDNQGIMLNGVMENRGVEARVLYWKHGLQIRAIGLLIRAIGSYKRLQSEPFIFFNYCKVNFLFPLKVWLFFLHQEIQEV